MSYGYAPRNKRTLLPSFAIVAALHLLLGWALVSGAARKGIDILNKPLAVQLIQDVTIAPPPPAVVQPRTIRPPESRQPMPRAPPPSLVPTPPIQKPTPDAALMEPVPTPPGARVEVAMPTQPLGVRPSPAPAPAPPAPAPPATPRAEQPAGKTDMRVACPTQVSAVTPPKAIRDGIEDVVKAQALIKNGVVTEVTVLSGHPVFHAAVKRAMLQYKCSQLPDPVLVTQEFTFKFKVD